MNARRTQTPDDARPLAAEYALGVLEGDERREAERRMAEDAAFRAEVEQWQEHFSPLNDDIAEVAPSPGVWSRIAAELGHEEKARAGLWNSLGVWRALTAAAGAIAVASLAALIALPRPVPAPDQPLVATLTASSDRQAFVVRFDAQHNVLAVRLVGGSGADSRVPELWIIPGDGVPRSLGVIDGGHADLEVAPAHRGFVHENGTLAVSLEPPGGSPTGKPTGPVVASGKLLTL